MEICAALRYSAKTDITFWRMTVEIFLSDFQTVVNGVLGIFSFQRLMPVFLWKCFSVARLSFCLHLHFVILLCVWECDGNGLYANWREWECKRLFLVISDISCRSPVPVYSPREWSCILSAVIAAANYVFYSTRSTLSWFYLSLISS